MDPELISAGISAASGMLGGITGFFSGQAKAKAYEAAANQAKAEAGINANTQLVEGDATIAQGAVRAAANGGGFVGSNIGALQNLSDQAMFNARTMIYRGQTEAATDVYNEHLAKAQAAAGLLGATGGAAGSLAAGWAKDAQFKQQQGYMDILRGEGNLGGYGYGMGDGSGGGLGDF